MKDDDLPPDGVFEIIDAMDSPPPDHGSDRYGYVELQNAPEGVNPPDAFVDDLLANACNDCNPNLFLWYQPPGVEERTGLTPAGHVDSNGVTWHVKIAHDETCPSPENQALS